MRPGGDSTYGGNGPAHLTIQGIGHALEERGSRPLVQRRRAWVVVGEAAHLVGHQPGEPVAVEWGGAAAHGRSMVGRDRPGFSGLGERTRRCGRSRCRSRGRPRGSWRSRWCRRRGGSPPSRCGSAGASGAWRPDRPVMDELWNGSSWCACLCFLARRHRVMGDRLRGRWSSVQCAGGGAWFGRSNRLLAADWLLAVWRQHTVPSIDGQPVAPRVRTATADHPRRRSCISLIKSGSGTLGRASNPTEVDDGHAHRSQFS